MKLKVLGLLHARCTCNKLRHVIGTMYVMAFCFPSQTPTRSGFFLACPAQVVTRAGISQPWGLVGANFCSPELALRERPRAAERWQGDWQFLASKMANATADLAYEIKGAILVFL